MERFADLLTDAFSESSVPSFSDGDLDFESLGFEEKAEEDKTENSTTNTDEALLQEVTDESEALLCKVTTDASLNAEDEESTDVKSDEEEFVKKGSEDSYTSSVEESSSSGEDVEDVGAAEEPGDLLMSVCCSDDPYDTQNEDEIFAEGQPMASEGTDSPKDANKVQGEAESDEEASHFGGIPECGDEMIMMEEGEAEEDNIDGEESSDSDHEDFGQEEIFLPQETENLYMDGPMVVDNLEFPCFSLQNLQDLVTEVDGEEQVMQMIDFTGDEYQEAGETIADYPSDVSSGEFTRAKLSTSPLPKQEEAVTETPWISSTEDEEDSGFLYSTDLEMNADRITSLDMVAREEREHLLAATAESNSYSSGDDEQPPRGTKDELMSVRGAENNTKLEDVQLQDFSRWSSFDDTTKDRSDPADFIRSGFDTFSTNTRLSEYLFTTEDTNEREDSSSDDDQCPTEDVSCYSVVQRVTTSPSNQGSIDDSFFFDIHSSEVTEQLVDDENEERRNAQQMQERIEAFKRFYDNSDEENGREERQIKVQFCADPLSQVNYYDTDSSDRDSLSSSTDMEEDLSSEELRDPEDLQRESEDLSKTHEDMREPKDLQREHDDLQREPEDLLRQNENMRAYKDLLREHKDGLREFEDTPEITPMCDPPNPELPQNESEVRDTQTCTKPCKGVSKLKLMLNVGVVTMTGLLMFWLITDQPDWLGNFFSV